LTVEYIEIICTTYRPFFKYSQLFLFSYREFFKIFSELSREPIFI